MDHPGAELPGSARLRFVGIGASDEDRQDLWLFVLEKWRLTIDQWEALPWWQQQAYLEAKGRAIEREKAKRAAEEAQAAGKGPAAGRPGPGAGSGRVSLKDSPFWGTRGRPPAGPVVMGPRPSPS